MLNNKVANNIIYNVLRRDIVFVDALRFQFSEFLLARPTPKVEIEGALSACLSSFITRL